MKLSSILGLFLFIGSLTLTILYFHPPQTTKFNQILDKGILTVSTPMNGVGCYFHQNQPAGLECDLLQAYGDTLGINIVFKKSSSATETLSILRGGLADIGASDLTDSVSLERGLTFSHPLFETREVLVQRKENAIKSIASLAGRTLVVHENSSYYDEIVATGKKIGLTISHVENIQQADTVRIKLAKQNVSILELINSVRLGDIDFTVADQHIAKSENSSSPNLNTELVFGTPRNVNFVVESSNIALLNSLNKWLTGKEARQIIQSYLAAQVQTPLPLNSHYIATQEALSPWDHLFQRYASNQFDWIWLAAQSYTESRFRPDATSLAGAQGLMQLMPETAKEVGVTDSFNPSQNIQGGSVYNLKQYKRWKHLPPTEAKAFSLASYNAGAGHVLDARRLAVLDKANPNQWFTTNTAKGVEDYIVLLEKSQYYTKPNVRYGYCRGTETRDYVRKIFKKEAEFRQLQHKNTPPEKVQDVTNPQHWS